jgi:Protein of unknown function (DUF3761)
MRTTIRLMLVAAGLMVSHGLMAQAPAGAPAGATGICKDGTYWTGASKSGACSGHKGVQTWYATAAAPAATPAAKAPAAAPAPTPAAAPVASKPAPTPSSAPVTSPAVKGTNTPTVAAGGGPGLVWVNTDSKVYHCPGSQFYGTTKQGKYMSEADAKAMGAHADHNKPCSTK